MMSVFQARLYFFDEETGAYHLLAAEDAVEAESEFAASQYMMDQYWDDRLDSAGCFPKAEIIPVDAD